MSWKFSCESKSTLLLPPEITFPQAFNYLNSDNNSYFILENKNGYIQCAGSKSSCTIEFRELLEEDSFRHFVFFNRTKSNDKKSFKMSTGSVIREERHSFNFLKAAKLFSCFFEGKEWPKDFELEEITNQFL